MFASYASEHGLCGVKAVADQARPRQSILARIRIGLCGLTFSCRQWSLGLDEQSHIPPLCRRVCQVALPRSGFRLSFSRFRETSINDTHKASEKPKSLHKQS